MAGVVSTRCISHSPDCWVTGTMMSATRAMSGVTIPSRLRAAGHTMLSTVHTAASRHDDHSAVHHQYMQWQTADYIVHAQHP